MLNVLNSSFPAESGQNQPKLAISYRRFSTPEQQFGDSERRQVEMARDYCQRNGLQLHGDREYLDHGISGFNGANKKDGRLGDLLNDANNGKIPRGTVLIVESLDRLSREDLLKQIATFTEILEAGLTIVTLAGGEQTYSPDSKFNSFQLLFAFMSMARGREESAVKSERVGKAWEQKKKEAREEKKPLTKICPAWLELNECKQRYEVRKERGKIVKEIFQMARDGFGRRTIAKTLNEGGITPWGKARDGHKRMWRDTYIAKTLKNRSVLGEYQPHTKPKGAKREPVGEPIPDYFPKIIEEDLFYAVQHKVSGRKNQGGRGASTAKNLFSNKLRCLDCGGRLVHSDKGDGYSYQVCERQKLRAEKCANKPIPYSMLEDEILCRLDGIDWDSIFDNDDGQLTSSERIHAKKQKIHAKEQDIAALVDCVQKVGAEIPELSARILQCSDERDALKVELVELEKKENQRIMFQAGAENWKGLKRFLDRKIKLTVHQRQKLKSSIDDVFSAGCFHYNGNELYGMLFLRSDEMSLIRRNCKDHTLKLTVLPYENPSLFQDIEKRLGHLGKKAAAIARELRP